MPFTGGRTETKGIVEYKEDVIWLVLDDEQPSRRGCFQPRGRAYVGPESVTLGGVWESNSLLICLDVLGRTIAILKEPMITFLSERP